MFKEKLIIMIARELSEEACERIFDRILSGTIAIAFANDRPVLALNKGVWEEEKHPRADDGKFTSGHGGGGHRESWAQGEYKDESQKSDEEVEREWRETQEKYRRKSLDEKTAEPRKSTKHKDDFSLETSGKSDTNLPTPIKNWPVSEEIKGRDRNLLKDIRKYLFDRYDTTSTIQFHNGVFTDSASHLPSQKEKQLRNQFTAAKNQTDRLIESGAPESEIAESMQKTYKAYNALLLESGKAEVTDLEKTIRKVEQQQKRDKAKLERHLKAWPMAHEKGQPGNDVYEDLKGEVDGNEDFLQYAREELKDIIDFKTMRIEDMD